MIVDASAIIAILHAEHDRQEFAEAIEAAEGVGVSAVTLFEAALKLERASTPVASRALDRFVRNAEMQVIAFEAEHAAIARDARQRYGRGSGHPAQLNFGDCMAYATAYIADEPLLYKGRDFARTDIRSALD